MSLNVYVLDVSPVLAAQMLDDARLVGAVAWAQSILNDAWLMMRRARGDKALAYRDIAHPRHPITRHVVRSAVYAEWVAEYGHATLQEAVWRGFAWQSDREADTTELQLDRLRIAVRLEHASDEDAQRTFVQPTSAEIADFPQRLEGGGDAYLVLGDPVAAYRRWYVDSKIPGGSLAWAGTEVVWTRRKPEWLETLSCQVASLPWSGLGSEPIHPQWVATHT